MLCLAGAAGGAGCYTMILMRGTRLRWSASEACGKIT